MNTLLIFAYGSNMLISRLRERVPSAKRLATAKLPGHALCWHKVSDDGSGKCDAFETRAEGAMIFGVVFEIAAAEKANLDRAEGLGHGYAEKQVIVETDDGPRSVQMYYATRIDPNVVPYDWYKAIVIAGARQNQLPSDYVTCLMAAKVKTDCDQARATRHFALVAQAAPVVG